MKRSLSTKRLGFLFALIFALASTVSNAHAKLDPDNTDIAVSDSTEDPLPPEIQAVIDRKVTEAGSAPAWVKELQTRKVSDYFPPQMIRRGRLSSEALAMLAADASLLVQYYEESDPNHEFQGVVEEKIKPLIQSMSTKSLRTKLKGGPVTQPLGEWTVEQLVVVSQLDFLSRYPDSVERMLGMITKRHLKGCTIIAGTIVVSVGIYSALRAVGIDGPVLDFFIGTLVGGIRAGPVAQVMNAFFGWWVRPTTEGITVINKRYTGGAEKAVNHLMDGLKHALIEEEPGVPGESQSNDRPKIATLEQDGMNFAYMTVQDQAKNWKKNLRMWVAVQNLFGQLLRDTHHAGRVLMMISWSDEQGSTQMIETMDSKLVSLNIEAEQLLTPLKTALLIRGEGEKKLQLEKVFDEYQALCASTWLQVNLSQQKKDEIFAAIGAAQIKLFELGLSERDMLRLMNIQVARSKAVGTIVTALAMNEIRSFNVAEANRNLESEARDAQRVIRKGFHLQGYVEEYLPLLQDQMRRMGYSVTGVRPDSAIPCHELLTVGARR